MIEAEFERNAKRASDRELEEEAQSHGGNMAGRQSDVDNSGWIES